MVIVSLFLGYLITHVGVWYLACLVNAKYDEKGFNKDDLAWSSAILIPVAGLFSGLLYILIILVKSDIVFNHFNKYRK